MSEVCGDTNIDKKNRVADAVPARWAIAGKHKDFIMCQENVPCDFGTVEAKEMGCEDSLPSLGSREEME